MISLIFELWSPNQCHHPKWEWTPSLDLLKAPHHAMATYSCPVPTLLLKEMRPFPPQVEIVLVLLLQTISLCPSDKWQALAHWWFESHAPLADVKALLPHEKLVGAFECLLIPHVKWNHPMKYSINYADAKPQSWSMQSDRCCYTVDEEVSFAPMWSFYQYFGIWNRGCSSSSP